MFEKFRTQNGPLQGSVSYTIQMPANVWFIAEIADALRLLTEPENWLVQGDVTIEQATNAAIVALRSFDRMIGTIVCYITADAPSNSLPCDGASYLRTAYPELYAVLDPVFQTDADNFVVPDLRGKTIIGVSSGHAIGSTGGEETHQLTVAELAAHGHSDTGHQHTTGNSLTFLALTGEEPVLMPNPIPAMTGSASANISNTGSDTAHNNMQPYVALKYAVIAL